MAGARATANGVALGQVKTDAHSNAITAIPELRKTPEIKGCAATIDAMGCRIKIARETVKRGADCVLAVKKNHPQLWDDIVGAFEYGERTRFATIEHDVFKTVNKGHGRVERRRLGDLRPVGGRTRERPRRVGEHERRGDDRIHAAGGLQDDGSQTALHNESACSCGPDPGGCEGALGS